MLDIQQLSIETAVLSYAVFGKGAIDMVIEMGLGSCIGEWWHVAERLSKSHTILLYERAGCAGGKPSTLSRTPENIAAELHVLLKRLGCENKITLLAHSQGGLYAQQFARLYPQELRALILLDPLSAREELFQANLTKREYQRSGVDKSFGMKLSLLLARLNMTNMLKKAMRDAPPFYYYDGFSKDTQDYILTACTCPGHYRTALLEYRMAHQTELIKGLASPEGFPTIPVFLITHSSEKMKREIMEFGGMDEAGLIRWKVSGRS